jgi:Mn-containing catalase
MKAFSLALDSMGRAPFSIGELPPNPEWVNKYFNDSTGTSDYGETDERGPWNEGGDWEYVESPAVEEFTLAGNGSRKASAAAASETGRSHRRR